MLNKNLQKQSGASNKKDFRSDTVTQPTQAMREAMYRAEVGDDVIGEDPSVNALQEYSAELLGKEAALFVPSGTMGNQCAILSQTNSGNEVLLAERCHIIQHEAGAAALLSRVQLRTLSANSTHLQAKDLRTRIRDKNIKDVHYPQTGLICVEQATADGTVVPIEELAAIQAIAKTQSVPIHMDGARLFNAAVALNKEPRELSVFANTVSFCLSKGLCAPVGSVLAGTKAIIDRARGFRKILGGGMRQAGFLAAAGMVALKEIRPNLKADHDKATLLAERLREIPGAVIPFAPQINMVFLSLENYNISGHDIMNALRDKHIYIYPDEDGVLRFVTHHYISEEGIHLLVDALRPLLEANLKA